MYIYIYIYIYIIDIDTYIYIYIIDIKNIYMLIKAHSKSFKKPLVRVNDIRVFSLGKPLWA